MTYLVLGGIAIVVAFGFVVAALYWRHGRGARVEAFLKNVADKDYAGQHDYPHAAPKSRLAWPLSALTDRAPDDRPTGGWPRRAWARLVDGRRHPRAHQATPWCGPLPDGTSWPAQCVSSAT